MSGLKRPDGHQFTRAEIGKMSTAEFDANHDEIMAQTPRLGAEKAQAASDRRASNLAAP